MYADEGSVYFGMSVCVYEIECVCTVHYVYVYVCIKPLLHVLTYCPCMNSVKGHGDIQGRRH